MLQRALVGLTVLFVSASTIFAAEAIVTRADSSSSPPTTGADGPGIVGEGVVGQYIEARTCDVWTGPCFANGEINLRGNRAVMGWAVQRGRVNGVSVAGLKVVAVLGSEGTLHTDAEGKVRSALYIDSSATPAQARALRAMAIKLAPTFLRNIVHEEQAAIRYHRDGQNVTLQVGKVIEVKTQALNAHCDVICGNEEQAYPPLTRNAYVSCAKTVAHAYRGSVLKARWSEPDTRSAMVGSFVL